MIRSIEIQGKCTDPTYIPRYGHEISFLSHIHGKLIVGYILAAVATLDMLRIGENGCQDRRNEQY